jgi:hypothetical protein
VSTLEQHVETYLGRPARARSYSEESDGRVVALDLLTFESLGSLRVQPVMTQGLSTHPLQIDGDQSIRVEFQMLVPPLLVDRAESHLFDVASRFWRRTVRRFEGRCSARADRFSSVQRWRR